MRLNEVLWVERDVVPGWFRCRVRRLWDGVERVVRVGAACAEEAFIEAAYCRTS